MKISKQPHITDNIILYITVIREKYNKTQTFYNFSTPPKNKINLLYTNTCNISLWIAKICYVSMSSISSPGLVFIASWGFEVSFMEVVVSVISEGRTSLTLFVCSTPFISKTDNTTYMIWNEQQPSLAYVKWNICVLLNPQSCPAHPRVTEKCFFSRLRRWRVESNPNKSRW